MTAAAAAQLLGRPGPGQVGAGILASSAAMCPGYSMITNMKQRDQGVLPPRSGHESLSEQRLAIGGGHTSAPARRPGWRTGLERGLDGSDDELRGLHVDDDVPAEQYAADDLPGVQGRVLRADGGASGTRGIGYRCHPRNSPRRLPFLMVTSGTVEETVLVGLLDTPDSQRLYDDHRAAPARSGAPQVIMSPTVRYDRPLGHRRPQLRRARPPTGA
jgi:hypothetical protein